MSIDGNVSFVETPFFITFTWKENVVKISLVNGNDLIKIAMLLSELMTKNGIENKIEKINKNETLHN
jgi:hypothetical protein